MSMSVMFNVAFFAVFLSALVGYVLFFRGAFREPFNWLMIGWGIVLCAFSIMLTIFGLTDPTAKQQLDEHPIYANCLLFLPVFWIALAMTVGLWLYAAIFELLSGSRKKSA